MTGFLDLFAAMSFDGADEVARRLEAGDDPARSAEATGLGSVGMVAAIARVGLGADDSTGPPLVHAAPNRPALAAVVARESTLAALFPRSSRPDRLALAAGLLQVLDAWDESHQAAQEADDLGEGATAAAWHMIAHRREPDAGNARYWLRRAAPATFAALGPLVRPWLTAPGIDPTWPARLLGGPNGAWNPVALIDLAGRVRPGSEEEALARRLQRSEMLVLLGESLAQVG